MGCFGDMETVKETNSTQTTKLPDWVNQAGRENYELARELLSGGYKPYTGDRVAGLSGNEQAAIDLIGGVPRSNQYHGDAASAFQNYGSAPGFQYDFNTVVDENGPLGSISSYMNPYLMNVLNPMLREISRQGQAARLDINSNATQAGAYGDARHGVVESEQRRNEAILSGDTTGKAFSDSFNSAMGLRTSDLARYLQTQQLQEGADKSQLERARTSAIDLTNLDKYELSRALGLASSLGSTGALERKVEQDKIDADVAEHERANGGWTREQLSFLSKILGLTPYDKTTIGTSTVSEPDNSGWNMIGSLAGSLFGAAAAPFTGGASLAAIPAMFGSSLFGYGNPSSAAYGSNPFTPYGTINPAYDW